MNAHVKILKPYGMPQGMNPRTWRQEVEKRLNDLLDRAMSLINALDLMEADVDLEETGDDESSLGWPERGPVAYGCQCDDREMDNCDDEDGHDAEEENEHGGDILDQPHDDNGDSEPWLGWGNPMAQNGVGVESLVGLEDTPDCCGIGQFTGEGADEARRMLRGRGRNEPSLTTVAPAIAIANWYGLKEFWK
ncbi:hypothetical protein BFX40_23615 [Mesorhizobium sp. SEMIA 3007]|uniref:hypothetical protein n=1 Tax=Mesorhizobium sp. SEMIA 3007 TaxID=1862350 RepID=UPI00083DF53C|nr:hypothetical protein [Mesorhizobium sp. SEMIA 3007]ODA95552.1 hypothetical protein BFX40_23615 [Mesorhizobium sp. SEMIA 3007]